MLYISGILLLAGIILFWLSGRQRRSRGLPPGRVIFSDHDYWGKVERSLYDPVLNLTGKPDYLLELEDGIVPVEVKSTQLKGTPYDSHIYQLAAYCLLVERTFDVKPPYGILHYPNQDFAIDYTPELKQSIISLVRAIRSQAKRKNIDRSHQSTNRCRQCGYRTVCDLSLV